MVYSSNVITQIADSMVNMEEPFSGPTKHIAGLYTYIGQMISHDIVPNTNPFADSRKVEPWLNLGSMYGELSINDLRFSNKDTPFMKGHKFLLAERFDNNSLLKVTDFQRVERGQKFVAVVPEARNDENIIIAQLHLLWLKLHNFLIDKNIAEDAWQARQLMVLLFQHVVVNEFLKRFLQEDIFNAYFIEGKSYFPTWDKSRIPTFFSHAVFRFGHSSIRNIYTFRKTSTGKKSLRTHQLFKKGQKLDPENKIVWADFFPKNAGTTDNHALQIDSALSAGMSAVNRHNPHHPEVNVIMRNLEAGMKANLKSGTDYYNEIVSNIKLYGDTNIINISKVDSLAHTKFANIDGVTANNLPLWLYILCEASQIHNGHRLGMVGSVLIAEVIRNSILGSNISLYESIRMAVSPRVLKRFEELKEFIDVNKPTPVIAQIADLVD